MDNSGHASRFNIDTPVFEAPRPIIPDEQIMPGVERDVSQLGNIANTASFGNSETGMQMEPQGMAMDTERSVVQNEQMQNFTPVTPEKNNVAVGDSIDFGAFRTNKNGLEKKGLEQVTKMLSKFEKTKSPFSLVEDYEKAVDGNLKNSFNRVIGGEKAA